MKAAPVMWAISEREIASQVLVHTGQHYDANMSGVFFGQLGLPEPHMNLQVGSDSHAVQTAQIMMRLEPVLLKKKPSLVLVYGDVNSTIAAALVCSKLFIPVGHVEAGLRSFDRTMPEEINRLLTDRLSDLLFTPSRDGNENLIKEGIAGDRIHLVGNVIMDTLVRLQEPASERFKSMLGESNPPVPSELLSRRYGLVTLHRPSNVDNPPKLGAIFKTLQAISGDVPIVFPMHPRTRRRILEFGLEVSQNRRFHLVDPLSYLDFLAIQKGAAFVITDSGGIQEETTLMGIPCLTMRENTERPITVELGTNILVGQDMVRLKEEVYLILHGAQKEGSVPPLWDGKASERIAGVISDWAGV